MEVADKVFSRALGLMFRRKPVDMLFTFPFDSRFSIWTPFMFFSLDLFFLDKDFGMVETRKNLVPWRFYRPKGKFRYLFEAPAGEYSSGKVREMVKNKLEGY